MHLQDGACGHFMKFIEREFPSMRPRFERLHEEQHAPEAYRMEVKAMVRVLQERHGLARPDAHTAKVEAVPAQEAEQVGFAW